MTATQETVDEAGYRGQEATVGALQMWADSVKKLYGSLPTSYGKAPSVADFVDHYFDFAEHVLEIQRKFAKSLMACDYGDHDPRYDKNVKYGAKDGATKRS